MANFFQNLKQRAKREIGLLPATLRFMPEALREKAPSVLAKIGEKVTPGYELAKGLGYVGALPAALRGQTRTERQRQELTDMLARKIKTSKDEKQKKRYKSIVKNLSYESPLKTITEEAPTGRQVAASAGELALLATAGYKPYLKTGRMQYGHGLKQTVKGVRAAKEVIRASKGPFGKLLQKGVTVAKGAGEGAIGFGLLKAREKEATIQDIIKSAEMGAKIGGGLALGGLVIGGLSRTFGKYVKPKITQRWERAMTGLEEAAEGISRKPQKLFKSQLDETLTHIGMRGRFKQKVAKGVLAGVNVARKMKVRFIDRFAPAQRIEQKITRISGRPLQEQEKIYRDMRLWESAADAKAEKYLDDMYRELTPYQKVEKKAWAWMSQLDFLDRSKLGQAVPGGQTQDDLIIGLRKLADEIGPDDMQAVGKYRQIVNKYQQNLLQMRVDAGLISGGLKNQLLTTHPNYVPHDVIFAIDQDSALHLSSSLNVPKTDIMRAVGSTRNIKNPAEAMVRRAQISHRLIEKNKILNNFVNAQAKYQMFPSMRKASTMTPIKKGLGQGTINLFSKGEKQTWIVPEDIAVAIKNLDTPVSSKFWRFFTAPQRLLKKSATQYNLSFTVPNKFRDKQTAALTANAFIEEMARKTGVSPRSLNLSADEIKGLYKESGGYGASIFREGESKVLGQFRKGGIGKHLKQANPAKIVDAVNDGIEKSTRLEVFKRSLQRGLSPKDAALVSRDATIDFARMGTWMRKLNQAIPFFNARVQGFTNLAKVVTKNPEMFARMQMWTAVFPTMFLHQHNRRYDSFKNIDQYYKNKYWIVMTGETDAVDNYSGNPIKVPQFVTIPKGEGQQMVSSPIQYYLDKSDGIDFRKTSEMIADTIGAASPMEFQSFNQANWLQTVISQFGPLATIATGLASNEHPYFGSQIVPESRKKGPKELQFKRTTPGTTKELTKLINSKFPKAIIAPAEVEFVINSFGGVAKDTQEAVNLLYGLATEKKVKVQPVSETLFGKAAKIPGARRFVREAIPFFAPMMEQRKGQKQELEEKYYGEKILLKDRAEEVFIDLRKLNTKEERKNYLLSLGDEFNEDLLDKIVDIKKYRNSVEALSINDPIEIRARYILLRLDEMQDPEEKKKFLLELTRAKILTESTLDKIVELKSQ